MRRTIFLVLLPALILAVLIGTSTYYVGPGYVVLSFSEYTVETSFVFMAGSVALSFLIFYYLLRILSRVINFPGYMGRRHVERQSERSKNSLVKGLIEMSEGRFEQAEKMFLKQVNHSDTSLLNYLMAARAAQQLGEYDRRDEYLRLAHESTPSADIAIGLTQAELQLSHKQFEQALATLNHLSSVSPRHSYVKKLQARSYQQLGDWDSLEAMLDELRKMKALTPEQYSKLELDAYSGLLTMTIKQVDGEKTELIWKKIPKHLKLNEQLIRLYGSYLHKNNKDNEAETIIRSFLSESWNDELAILYSELQVKECKKQLETAETWLHNQPRNACLLMVLGKLCLKCQLWGKARSYFESSIGVKPLAEAHLQLARLLEEKMDEHDKAQEVYQKGLSVAVEHEHSISQPGLQISSDRTTRPQLKIIQ